jgi:hypothetical protein
MPRRIVIAAARAARPKPSLPALSPMGMEKRRKAAWFRPSMTLFTFLRVADGTGIELKI